jgi:predicted PurR-regulated permease PerM
MDAGNPMAGAHRQERHEGDENRRAWPPAVANPRALSSHPGTWSGPAQAAVIGIFVILFIAALSLGRPIVLPVTAAFIFTMLLSPVAVRADDHGVPALVTAIVLWLMVAAVFYAVIMLVSSPVIDWVNKAPDIGRSIQQKLQLFEEPLTELRELRNAVLPSQTGQGVNVDLVAIVKDAVSVVTPAVGQMIIFFVSLFFMLLGRRRLRHALVAFFRNHDSRLRALRIMNDIERNLTGYLSVVAVINACVGIGAGIIAAAVGLPDPLAWGVLGFILNFIPYIGATIMEIGMFLVGLVAFPWLTHALIAPLLYIGMALLEGQIITPSTIGHRFTLNPLIVFLSLVFWAWLWGPVGAFLAVPLLIVGTAAGTHMFPKDELDLPG